MQFYKFWTRARHESSGTAGKYDVSCFGFSNESLEDALRIAEQRARATAQKLSQGDVPEDQYYGGSSPFREEVVEEFLENGEIAAIISRNRYGCLVLNTPEVFIADIDKPEKEKENQANPLQTVLSIFGFGSPVAETQSLSFEEQLIEKIDQHCQQNHSLGMRLYRTTNGYRVIVTSELIPAGDPRSGELLNSLGSDALYVKLCRTQECYRARLTPKPWRCGAKRPPCQFPFDSNDQEANYRKWEESYRKTIVDYATCALVGSFGSRQTNPIADKIVRLHDHYVLNEQRPIA